MTITLSKLQLNTILSALDGQRRNPSSREVALKRIGRHAETLQLALDDLLTAASGLLDGRMDAAAFLAALRSPAPHPHEEEPMAADEGTAADQPALGAFIGSGESVASDQAVPEFQADAETGASVATDQPAATHCPSCGRKLRAPRTQAARQSRPRGQRDGSKEAQVIEMLRRQEGATIAQIMAATGWQAHTVRGAFAGALKKRRGLAVTSEKPQGGERIYRIA